MSKAIGSIYSNKKNYDNESVKMELSVENYTYEDIKYIVML